MKSRSFDESEKLNFGVTFGKTIRLLYHVGLDYCVLRSLETQKIVCASKDQLVSLLERGYDEKKLGELFELADKKDFKPSLQASIHDIEKTQVLAITEDGGSVISADKAFSPVEYEFPEWWSAPLPLVFLTKDKIVLNEKAESLRTAKPLLRVNCASLPLDRKEFFITLEEKNKTHTVMLKKLARNIHLLEDVTNDVETAEDIAWWAAVGKAMAAKFECEGKILVREGEHDKESLEETLVCEWDGKRIGNLCICAKNPKPKNKKK